MKSVFVCDVNLTPVGTAFVISPDYVMSAYHCVADDFNKPSKKHANEWLLTTGLERDSRGVVSAFSPNSVIEVEVERFVIKDDWVLLRRKDRLQFSPDVVVPVCQEGSVPLHEDEARIKIYHCPIDLFRDGLSDAVRPCAVEQRLGMTTNHRAFVQTGLFGGSSGGLYALMNGEALAMHIETVSTSQSVSDFESEGNFDEKQCVSEASDSCANTYASFVSGIILCRYKNLMQCLQPQKSSGGEAIKMP